MILKTQLGLTLKASIDFRMDTLTAKYFRKFKEPDYYQSQVNRFFLLPFRFHQLDKDNEVIVNEVGDFLIVPVGTSKRIVERDVTKSEPLYKDLISNFFISETPVPELIDVLATRYRTKKQFLEGFTALHIFVISLRCEHTCQYCQVSRVTTDKERFDMSRIDIDRGIEMMMKSPSPHVTMEFQGGEALLAFDNIVYAIKHALEKASVLGKEITFVICTNLALITEEILHFCKEYDVLISTSLDGPQNVHDSNRHKPHASSYDLTIKGINLSRSILGHDKVSALMTTSQLSLSYPVEIVDEYFNQGFDNLFLRNISPYGFALRTEKNRYTTEKFLSFYKTALNRIIEYNLNGHFMIEGYAQILLAKMLTPFNTGFVDLQSPSGLVTSVVVFNYDGGVYASDESRMLAEQGDFQFKLGTLEDDYDELFYGSKAREIASVSTNESLAGCSECAFQTYCGADPVHNWSTQGDMYGHRPTSDFCLKNMEIIKHLMNLIQGHSEVRKVLLSWIR